MHIYDYLLSAAVTPMKLDVIIFECYFARASQFLLMIFLSFYISTKRMAFRFLLCIRIFSQFKPIYLT